MNEQPIQGVNMTINDGKTEIRSHSTGKQSSFKPTKPENISRPQNIKVPPPAPKGK